MATRGLDYQDGLGSPWFNLFGYPVYLPWRLTDLASATDMRGSRVAGRHRACT
jgi:hypothetical protein